MNKIYLYIALAMTTGLAACSSDDNASEGTGGGQNTNNVVNLLPTQATKVAFTSNSVPLSNDVIVGWEDATKTTIDRNAEETSIKSTITDALSDLSKYNTDFMYMLKLLIGSQIIPYFYLVASGDSEPLSWTFLYMIAGGTSKSRNISIWGPME